MGKDQTKPAMLIMFQDGWSEKPRDRSIAPTKQARKGNKHKYFESVGCGLIYLTAHVLM